MPTIAEKTLEAVRLEARGCKACPLWKDATQTVFGDGPAPAPLMFVGEQPGDKEDLVGEPFVGPAGLMFDKAMDKAGLDRRTAYVTNAVHFKFEPRGKRRLHKKPNSGEIQACFPWLKQEIGLVQPRLIVALGSTAVRALAGKPLPVIENRGRSLPTVFDVPMFVTVHPSSLLRAPDPEERRAAFEGFVADLKKIPRLLGQARDAA
ncbi:MAG TPA: UdgX family uracil-DNA binding protein [Aestuariivirgaceae bacterium]|nr:UdgX family uracil-DNA binding protein [Aestuariivirgaceae bacterium]